MEGALGGVINIVAPDLVPYVNVSIDKITFMSYDISAIAKVSLNLNLLFRLSIRK